MTQHPQGSMDPMANQQYWRRYALVSRDRDDPRIRADMRCAFCTRLVSLLGSILGERRRTSAGGVAACLFERMSDPSLHYHTPLHILSMLDFAEDHGIDLSRWKKLAVWFHDAIYWPSAPPGKNERSSVLFMRSLLAGAVPTRMLDLAAAAIEATALHDRENANRAADWILDLDLCNLAWEWPDYEAANENVGREHIPIHGEKHYRALRRGFLRRLLVRKSIYRTKQFRTTLESAARANLARSLAQAGGH